MARPFCRGYIQNRGGLFHLEALENIADLHVVEIRDADAALVSITHFVHIFLEAAERIDAPSVSDDAIAHDADFRIALDEPIEHIAAGDHADALDAEGVAD